MSMFSGRPASQRSFGGDGYLISSTQLIPTRPPVTTAGVPVTTTTALQKVALLSACNVVCNMPDVLPAQVSTNSGGILRPQPTPQAVADPEAMGYGIGDFGYKFLLSAMLRGNVFIRADAVDNNGRVTVANVLNPDEISTRRNPTTGAWEFGGLDGKTMSKFLLSNPKAGSIVHVRAFPQPGGLLGLSIVGQHARTLGLSLASEQFAADFFADGAHPTGVLSSKEPITSDQAKTIKQRFVNAIRGSREPAVLGQGLEYKAIQVAPGESQFLEVQKYTSAEICRMVGPGIAELLGYETGGAMTYQNVQSRSLHVLIYAVDPWLCRLERFFDTYMLPKPQTISFNRKALLRMTPGDQWAVRLLQLKTGSRYINEIRAEDGDPGVPWGDEPFLPAFGPTAAAAAVNAGDQPGIDPANSQSEAL